MLCAALMAGPEQRWLAEEEGRTSTVRWPCMCVMQEAAVLRMVRLASFPDALHHHEMRPWDLLCSRCTNMLRCCSQTLHQDPVHAPIA